MRPIAARLGLILLVAVGTKRLNGEERNGADKGLRVRPQMKADLPARPSIEHEALVCLTTSRYPRIEARISPSQDVQRAWVRFRSDPATGWYAVQLKKEGTVHVGLLPVPRGLKTFTYFLEASDERAAATRAPAYSPLVVGDAKACPDGTASSSVPEARALMVERPPDASQHAAPVPHGFGARGTVGAVGVFDWSSRATARIAGAPCVEVVSPAHSPAGGFEEFVVGGPLVASASCSLPFATGRVTGSLLMADRQLVPGTSPLPLDVAYTFVP
jgi:hypothetical protein